MNGSVAPFCFRRVLKCAALAASLRTIRSATSAVPHRVPRAATLHPLAATCFRRARLAVALALFLPILTGCIYPEREQSQWRWKQFSPEYRPLPGDEAP